MRFDVASVLVQIGFLCLVAAFLILMSFGAAALALPIAIAFLVALALNPVTNFLESGGLPRIVASAVAMIAFVAIAVFLIRVVGGAVVNEVQAIMADQAQLRARTLFGLTNLRDALADSLPDSIVTEHLNPERNLQRVEALISDSKPADLSFLGVAVTYTIVTPIISFVLLLQGQAIYRSLLALAPNRYFEMTLLLVNNIQVQLVAYIKGLGLQWLIMASIVVPGFLLIGLPYGPLIGLVVATTNIIPYLGPGLGLASALAVALMQPGGALIVPVLLVIALAQLVDNVFTQPVVLAGSVEIHPLIAILAVIPMQQWFGMAGMVIAIPFVSILVASIQIIYRQLKAFNAL